MFLSALAKPAQKNDMDAWAELRAIAEFTGTAKPACSSHNSFGQRRAEAVIAQES